MFQTEVEFNLPCGYVDEDGTLHRDGTMRRATAADEILPLKDPRVVRNPAYLVVILLSRVVTRLGGVSQLTPKVVESLFATDLAYLQDLYNELNDLEGHGHEVVCPNCSQQFLPEAVGLGVIGYPLEQLRREVAFVAFHFHWSHDEVMGMEHEDRRKWVEQISSINRELNAGTAVGA